VRLRGAVATVTAIALGAGFAVLAAGAPSHPTTLTIVGANFTAQPITIAGKVASKDADCVSGRAVKATVAPAGTVTVIGRDRASHNGYWGIESDAQTKTATVKVPPTKVGPSNHRATCEGITREVSGPVGPTGPTGPVGPTGP
jgi:hypothetical protein